MSISLSICLIWAIPQITIIRWYKIHPKWVVYYCFTHIVWFSWALLAMSCFLDSTGIYWVSRYFSWDFDQASALHPPRSPQVVWALLHKLYLDDLRPWPMAPLSSNVHDDWMIWGMTKRSSIWRLEAISIVIYKIYRWFIPSISTINQDSSWIRKVGSRTVSGAFQNTMRPSPKISNTIPDRILPGDLRDHGPTTLKNVEFWVDLIRQFFESSFFSMILKL